MIVGAVSPPHVEERKKQRKGEGMGDNTETLRRSLEYRRVCYRSMYSLLTFEKLMTPPGQLTGQFQACLTGVLQVGPVLACGSAGLQVWALNVATSTQPWKPPASRFQPLDSSTPDYCILHLHLHLHLLLFAPFHRSSTTHTVLLLTGLNMVWQILYDRSRTVRTSFHIIDYLLSRYSSTLSQSVLLCSVICQ